MHELRGELADGRLRVTGFVAGNMGILWRLPELSRRALPVG